MANIIGLVTNEGLSYSAQAAANLGWYIIPTGFAVSETQGIFDVTRDYASMNTTWYSAYISSVQVINANSLQFTCTIPPGSTLVQKTVGEIYLTAILNTTDFLLLIAQPNAVVTYDPDGALTFRLIVTITNLDLSANYIFSYTQATEISEHNLDVNAHPSFQDYLLGKVRVENIDDNEYLGEKFNEDLFEVEYNALSLPKITMVPDSITEAFLKIQNTPTDAYVLTWNAVTQKMLWSPQSGGGGYSEFDAYINEFTSSATWTVVHNLSSYAIQVQCWDATYNSIEYTGIVQDSADQCTITFGGAQTGIVVIVATPYTPPGPGPTPEPGTDGYFPFSSSSSWVVDHNYSSEYLMLSIWDDTDSLGEFKLLPNTIYKNTIDQLIIDWDGNNVNGYVSIIEVTTGTGQHTEAFISKTQVTVTHNLNNDNVIVVCWRSDGYYIVPNYIEKTGLDTLVIDFDGASISGALCVVSTDISISGGGTYAHSYGAATSWTVTHNLSSENIIVQCWDTNNKVVIPDSIIIDSSNQITVDFLTDSVAGDIFVINVS